MGTGFDDRAIIHVEVGVPPHLAGHQSLGTPPHWLGSKALHHLGQLHCITFITSCTELEADSSGFTAFGGMYGAANGVLYGAPQKLLLFLHRSQGADPLPLLDLVMDHRTLIGSQSKTLRLFN